MNAQEKQAYMDQAEALALSTRMDVERLRVRRDDMAQRMAYERDALVEKMNGLVATAEATHANALRLVAEVEAIEVEAS